DGILIGKGTDWQVGFSGGSLYLVLNNALVASSIMPLPNADGVPIFHWAYKWGHNKLSGFLQGKKAFEVDLNITLNQSSSAVRLGADSTGAKKFTGDQDEIRVWAIPRTNSEIAAFAGVHVDPSTTGLVGYWRCDEATGSTLKDSSPSANHATIVGTATWIRHA